MMSRLAKAAAILFGKYEYGIEYTVNVSDIIIPDKYVTHPPKANKMKRKRARFDYNGKFESIIFLHRDFELIDGYTSYLIAKERGMMKVPVYFVD